MLNVKFIGGEYDDGYSHTVYGELWPDEGIEKDVYANCCDCIRHGYGFGSVNTLGLSEDKARQIYNKAFNDMASDF